MREKILEYVKNKYGTLPDYPWEKDPKSGVLKHKKNKKWYALFMCIPGSRIGLEEEETLDILNVKLNPDMVASLNQQKGFAPAYHMNKTHWLTIILDGEASLESIYVLLDESYELTK